ncbi:hypothetical protein TNCV_2257921 [Trichonephila clavipes]|nr:hypothetical protein TNCV_2257921 [Trichonephila clavipes]
MKPSASVISASRFPDTGPRLKPRARQGQLSLSSLQWIGKWVPSMLGNLTLEVLRQTKAVLKNRSRQSFDDVMKGGKAFLRAFAL